MAVKLASRKNQRGSVAVEFALVFPVLLTLMGMMSAIGLGLKARHQLLNYSAAAARYCAFQTPTPAMMGSLPGCVTSYVNYLVNQADNMPPCINITVTPEVKPGPGGANVNMRYLTVQMSCEASWVPIVGLMPGSTLGGTLYPVVAKSSMPFMLPQGP